MITSISNLDWTPFLKKQHFVLFITIVLCSCSQQRQELNSITGSTIKIQEDHEGDSTIDAWVSPYRDRINTVLDSTLAHAPKMMHKNDGKLNSSIGNLMADIVMERTATIFERRQNLKLDFTVLNHGGIRSIISTGPVSARTAYQIMPFENYIVVVDMPGSAVKELLTFLARSKRAHPISGMSIKLDGNGTLKTVKIQGEPFEEQKNYRVATTDYLVQGGDSMGFFSKKDTVYETGYLLRNALIDHFKVVDTLKANVDQRFITEGNE